MKLYAIFKMSFENIKVVIWGKIVQPLVKTIKCMDNCLSLIFLNDFRIKIKLSDFFNNTLNVTASKQKVIVRHQNWHLTLDTLMQLVKLQYIFIYK